MRRALLCACSEYRDPAFAPLKFPLNDIKEVRQLLEERELCDFEDIAVLANPGKSEAHEAIEHLTADSEQDDLILFYFSGHGKLARDGSVALVLNDTKENRLHSTGLLDDELRILFNASRARKRVIILDCCYAGAVGEEGFKRASEDAVETMAHQIKGTFVLAASTKFQPALECAETKGSAFTSCLVEGVRTGAAGEKDTGRVTLAKLGEYLAREVPMRSNQQPKFWDFGGVGGTVIAHVPLSFDNAWIEQTLKRLRQMMAREQIDDALFVELQQVLRSSTGVRSQDRLGLIDDLAQRRIRPVPFLRKWQRLAQTELPYMSRVDPEPKVDEPATVPGPELQEPAQYSEPCRETPAPDLEPNADASPFQQQPPEESPEPVDSTGRPSDDVLPDAGLMDGSWHGDSPMGPEPAPENEEVTYEPESAPTSSQVRQFDFVLISFSLLVGSYVIFRDSHQDDGMFYFIVPVLLIALWVRLWHRIEDIIFRVFLSLGILTSSYISAINFNDRYSFFEISGTLLVFFSLVLTFLYWRIWRSQTSQD